MRGSRKRTREGVREGRQEGLANNKASQRNGQNRGAGGNDNSREQNGTEGLSDVAAILVEDAGEGKKG